MTLDDVKELISAGAADHLSRTTESVVLAGLTIAGERKPETADGVRYIRMERAHGSFKRVFQLTENVDPDKVEARYRNGVLEVHVGKSEVSKPRVIQVKTD